MHKKASLWRRQWRDYVAIRARKCRLNAGEQGVLRGSAPENNKKEACCIYPSIEMRRIRLGALGLKWWLGRQ